MPIYNPKPVDLTTQDEFTELTDTPSTYVGNALKFARVNAGETALEFADVTVPTGANPTATIGLTANNGVATTFMRSDATPALGVGIVPTWTGIHTFTANTIIDGTTDAIQLRVQGHSTQTNNLMTLEQSDGTDAFQVTNTGATTIGTGGAGDSADYFYDNGTLAMVMGWDDSANNFAIAPATLGTANYLTLDFTNGLALATTTSQKVGFYGATPVVRQTGCAVPTDLATAITAITALRTALNNLGVTTVV